MKASKLLLNSMLPVALCISMGASAAGLDSTERQMAEWIDANLENAISLLEETVNIGSGTMNHDGVREVGVVMRPELDAIGLDTEWIEMPPEINRAGHLFGRHEGTGGPKSLLIGHLGTVFEAEDSFQDFVRDGNLSQGPGFEGMKFGNVVIV